MLKKEAMTWKADGGNRIGLIPEDIDADQATSKVSSMSSNLSVVATSSCDPHEASRQASDGIPYAEQIHEMIQHAMNKCGLNSERYVFRRFGSPFHLRRMSK